MKGWQKGFPILFIMFCLMLLLPFHANAEEQTVSKVPDSDDLYSMELFLPAGATYYSKPFIFADRSHWGTEFYSYDPDVHYPWDPGGPSNAPVMVVSYEYLNPATNQWDPTEVVLAKHFFFEHYFHAHPDHDVSQNGTYRFVISNTSKFTVVTATIEIFGTIWR